MKRVWKIAIVHTVTPLLYQSSSSGVRQVIRNGIKQSATANSLITRWAMATRFAFLFAPRLEITAVTQVPILKPSMIGIATLKGISVPERAAAPTRTCKTPTDAEDDWIIVVKSVARIRPIQTPIQGVWKKSIMLSRIPLYFWSSKKSTAIDISSMPCIRIAKPRQSVPISLFNFLFLLKNIIRAIPITAMIGAKNDGLRSFNTSIQRASILSLLASRYGKPVIQGVMVVPILVPISIPMVCGRVIMPEPTRPTIITVVADED